MLVGDAFFASPTFLFAFGNINVPSSQTLLARNGASNNFSFKQRGEDNSMFAKKHHHVYAPLKQFLSLSAV